MINVILVDDSLYYLNLIEDEIKIFFISYDYVYRIHAFTEYNEEFFKVASQELENKLYLFDIETVLDNGIDVARSIRQYDHEADIMFLTVHDTDEYKNKIVTSNIKSMGFIFKGNLKRDFPVKMREFIDNVEVKEMIKFKIGNSLYSFKRSDILYVTTNKSNRKTVIKTASSEIEVSLPLGEVEEILFDKSKYFVKVHRSYTINILRVLSLNVSKKEIIFPNNEVINSISKKYKDNLLRVYNDYHKQEKSLQQ